MSLYEALGIEKSASTEEIRRAYKDLARQKHPDRGGDPEEFKKIQEAHEVLSDEQRRRMYDMTGSVNGEPVQQGMAAGGFPFEFRGGMGPFGMPGVAFDLGSMFGGIFGGGGSGSVKRTRAGKSPNKHHDVSITLADFYKGRDIKLKFNQARRCGACNASGADLTEPCGACEGRGVRTVQRMIGPGMIAQSTGVCDVCNGEGKRVIRACKTCQGKRFAEREKMLEIQIRPGMREGQTFTLPGECSDSLEYEAPGDVVLFLRRADPPTEEMDGWEWRGDDLWIRKKITFAESVVGFRRELSGHPSGKTLVVGWRKGAIVHGAILQAPGWGMPKQDGTFGTCYVQLFVDAPESREWTMEERATLQSLLGGNVETMDPDDLVALQPSSHESKFV
jgi:DnaJ family protein A protein 2